MIEQLCEDEGCPHHNTPHICLESPYYIQKDPTVNRWLIISRDIRDDCPIVEDFATEAEAQIELTKIERERGALGIEVPLASRGFGV